MSRRRSSTPQAPDEDDLEGDILDELDVQEDEVEEIVQAAAVAKSPAPHKMKGFSSLNLPEPTTLGNVGNFVGKPVRRQLKLDLANRFCQYLAGGASVSTVLGMLSITPEQFNKWMSRGQDYLTEYEESGGFPKNDKYGELCCSFYQGVERALAAYRQELSHRVHTSDDWFRNYKILERREREVWGKESQQEVVQSDSDEQYE